MSAKKKLKNKSIEKFLLLATVGIAIILLIAAIGKLFYPSEILKGWDLAISVFELVFIAALLYFRNHFKMWIIAAVIFASWGGYAGFWCQVDLPCHCMGAKLHIPTALSLSLDGVFFLLALCFAGLLSKSKGSLYIILLLATLAVVVGWLVARGIYDNVILVT